MPPDTNAFKRHLHIIVNGAEGLKNTSYWGTQDPFVCV
jgi:hypothetical protein